MPLHTGRLSKSGVLLVDLRLVLHEDLTGELIGGELELEGVRLGPQAI